MTKTIAVALVAGMLFTVTALVVRATPSWYQMAVNQVGITAHCSAQTKPMLSVTGEGMTNVPVWIIVSDTTQENRAMAIALTALAAGVKVALYMDVSTCGGSYDCTSLYVLDAPVE